jgi:hypothetical protein
MHVVWEQLTNIKTISEASDKIGTTNAIKLSLDNILNSEGYKKMSQPDKLAVNNYIGIIKSMYDLLMMSEILLTEKSLSKGGSKKKT